MRNIWNKPFPANKNLKSTINIDLPIVDIYLFYYKLWIYVLPYLDFFLIWSLEVLSNNIIIKFPFEARTQK